MQWVICLGCAIMKRLEGAGGGLVAQLDDVQVSCVYNVLRDMHKVGTLI